MKQEKNTPKKYILTGSPGSGKSSILLELESRGEYIIREAAEDTIKLYQSKGISQPWLLPEFQKQILSIQIQRESRIPQNIERVFIDRGIPDGLAYEPYGTDTNRQIQKAIHRYDGVFIIESLGTIEKTKFRKENLDEALKLEKKLQLVYQTLGYKINRIPPISVTARTDQILYIIKSGGNIR